MKTKIYKEGNRKRLEEKQTAVSYGGSVDCIFYRICISSNGRHPDGI